MTKAKKKKKKRKTIKSTTKARPKEKPAIKGCRLFKNRKRKKEFKSA